MAWVRDENGNYKKTVRCSYCGQTGHSRRTCHILHPNGTPAQRRAKAREAEKAQRKLAREQRKLDKAAGKVVPKVARNCGYCGEQGHSRRHCPTLIQDKAALVDATVKYREALVEEVTEKGVGKGALLVSKQERWSNAQSKHVPVNFYHMILDTNFDNASPFLNWAVSKRDRHVNKSGRYVTVLGLNGDRYEMGHRQLCTVPHTTDPMTGQSSGRFTGETQAMWNQGGRSLQAEVIVRGEVSFPDDFASREVATAMVDEYFSNTTKEREHYNVLDRFDYLSANNQ